MTIAVVGKGRTSRALAEELGVGWNDENATHIIRWGNRRPMPNATHALNNARALGKNSDKFHQLKMMDEATPHVPIIEFSRNHEDLSGTILGRSTHHLQGRDVKVYKLRDEIGQHDFFTKYVEKDCEYRYHIGKIGNEYKVLYCQRKLPKEGTDPTMVCWNHRFGFKFSRVTQYRQDMVEASIAAVKACGLDFGAVDIFGKGRKVYVCEVNTAPGIEASSFKAYVDYFRKVIEAWNETR